MFGGVHTSGVAHLKLTLAPHYMHSDLGRCNPYGCFLRLFSGRNQADLCKMCKMGEKVYVCVEDEPN